MVATRSDVARAAGVSPAVVSYVINNGPRPVAEETRRRVEREIARLNYRPNAIASALRGGSTRSVGLLMPNPRDPRFAELSEAFDKHLIEHGFIALTGYTHYDQDRAGRYLETLVTRKVDGLILGPGVVLPDSSVDLLKEQPIVAIDADRDFSPFLSIVTLADEDAMAGVEHLQSHGHHLVGCVSSPLVANEHPPRTIGWRRQQEKAGAPAGDELIAIADTSERGGYEAAQQLLSEHGRPWTVHGSRPRALFVTSDIQAIGVIAACHDLGLRVPDDVAIVSMDGTRAATFTTPALTSVRQDLGYIAQFATEHLLGVIGDASREPRRLALRGNLVIGRSCGCDVHEEATTAR